MKNVKQLLRYYSTWVVIFFSGVPLMWQTMPDNLKQQLYVSAPWLQGMEVFIWIVSFLWVFTQARIKAQAGLPEL